MPVVVAVYDDGEGVVEAHVAGRRAQQSTPGSPVPRQHGVHHYIQKHMHTICVALCKFYSSFFASYKISTDFVYDSLTRHSLTNLTFPFVKNTYISV